LIVLRLVPVVLSLVALGAHFLRAGDFVLLGATLVLLGLVGVRRPWASRCLQAALILAAAEWVRTLVRLYGERKEAGQPALRMALILGGVALLTALSALVFRAGRVRLWYTAAPRNRDGAPPPAV
jgi:hypothetical protein